MYFLHKVGEYTYVTRIKALNSPTPTIHWHQGYNISGYYKSSQLSLLYTPLTESVVVHSFTSTSRDPIPYYIRLRINGTSGECTNIMMF
jgi:hypothetical protein